MTVLNRSTIAWAHQLSTQLLVKSSRVPKLHTLSSKKSALAEPTPPVLLVPAWRYCEGTQSYAEIDRLHDPPHKPPRDQQTVVLRHRPHKIARFPEPMLVKGQVVESKFRNVKCTVDPNFVIASGGKVKSADSHKVGTGGRGSAPRFL